MIHLRRSAHLRPGTGPKPRLLVFTDLDGTMLDPINYGWQPADSALHELRERKIPLIFCTSKTRAEVEVLRRELGHQDPYIAENGGIIVLPCNFLGLSPSTEGQSQELVIPVGRSYQEAVRALRQLARICKVKVKGFHQMSAAEIARKTGLSLAATRNAKLREASEPFQFVHAGPADIRRFRRGAEDHGFDLAEGARFWYLMMGSNKGQAMELLVTLLELMHGVTIRTIVLGDSSIDLSMLKRADLPILMPKPDGSFERHIDRALPNAFRAAQAGPEAWAHAVLSAVGSYETVIAGRRKQRQAGPANDWPAPAHRELSPSTVQAGRSKPQADHTTIAWP